MFELWPSSAVCQAGIYDSVLHVMHALGSLMGCVCSQA